MSHVQLWAPYVAAAGLIITLWAGYQGGRAGHLVGSVFDDRSFTASDRRVMRRAIVAGELPEAERLRRPSITLARHLAQFGPSAVPWRIPQNLGWLMLLCGLYVFPAILGVAIFIQAISLLVALGAIPWEWREIGFAKTYVGRCEADFLHVGSADD